MTQEDKELLLKDLSARLPYRVKVKHFNTRVPKEMFNIDSNGIIIVIRKNKDDGSNIVFNPCEIENVKPYLRPMSSMTEEEREDYRKAVDKDFAILEDSIDAPIAYKYSDGMIVRDKPLFNEIDWLNKNGFDYRGLIEKGLALEAPEGMYDIKNN